MWVVNKDTNKWTMREDTISVSDYESIKQDLKSMRFYQKCLSGSTYVGIDNLDSIYSILNNYIPKSYTYNSDFSTYIVSGSPTIDEYQISGTSSGTSSHYDFLNKFIPDYGMTLKNLFTPTRLIEDQIKNLKYVDLSTTQRLDLSQENPNLIIDGVKVKSGHRILVKDQYRVETVSSSTDPDTYFVGHYEIIEEGSTQSVYRIPNYENGIYLYQNNQLQREDDLGTYSSLIRYSVCVKLGSVNRELQYSLQRLSNGYYPEYQNGDPIFFRERHNYVLRNRMDYNNLFELSLKDTIKHATQSVYVDGITYSIPERSLSIGEFGSLIIDQEGLSNIVYSKYKVMLNSIDETSKYYWICGNDGTLLKVNKIDFEITKIDLDVFTDLLSIEFYNDLRGVVVGKFNQIWHTNNSGSTWNRIKYNEFDGFNYNVVLYTNIDRFYVGGDSGIFIEFSYSNGIWTAYKRRISKFDEFSDEYLLVDDILSIDYFNSSAGILSGTSSFISIGARNNNLFLYDLSNVISAYNFISIENNNDFGDVTSIDTIDNGSRIIFSTFDSIYQIDPFTSTFSSNTNVLTSTYSNYITHSSINSIFSYENSELLLVGNNSTWISSTTASTYSNVYDSNFFSRLKPRLLFMDYDIGSKLYWFDDYGQYRIPERIIIPSSDLVGSVGTSSISLTNIPGSTNWITYWKDRMKTFKYASSLSDSDKIEPSFEFLSSNNYGGTFSYGAGDISITYSIISNLMPVTQSSRFRSGVAISAPGVTTYDFYFYNYLGIWRVPTGGSNPPSEGDVIYIDSNVVTGKFIINRIFSSGGNYYQYFYTDFDENIITNLAATTYSIVASNLNRYTTTASNSINLFEENFNNHYIFNAFSIESEEKDLSLIGITHSFEIYGKYSQFSAYYNLESLVEINKLSGVTYSDNIEYASGFLNFGYTPTYNLLSYLSFIDSTIYTGSKEFFALPSYDGIPGPDSGQLNVDLIYIDTGNAPLPGPTGGTNKLYFGSNLKNIWESFFKWTFVDVTIGGSSTVSTDRLIILDKYYDDSIDPDLPYVIEFHDKILGYNSGSTITTIDIRSRRTLQEISDDLQYINRFHRPEWLVSNVYTSGSITSTYSNYETDINFKIPTDSYTKALISDSESVRDLTGIIYTDYKYELAIQITKLERNIDLEIGSIDESIGEISFTEKHGLITGDAITIELSGTQSSNWPIVLGYHIVTVTSDFDVSLNIDWASLSPPSDLPYLTCTYIRKDPFLNFQPIDIFDLGVGDRKIRQSVKIEEENYIISGDEYQLVDVDFTKYRLRLIDGLDLEILNNNFSWILEAEISDAVIGMSTVDELIWYKGVWECGRWFGGTWISGTWKSGDWYSGVWDSKNTKDYLTSVKFDKNKSNHTSSLWFGGRWFGGTWNSGTWYDGRWYGGIWNNGRWFDGTWNDGTWNNGQFMSGIWILGQWNDGLFNTSNGPSYWLDGKFFGGDFENGIWYNGEFNQKNNKKSKFGTKSSNTRNSDWYGGKFISGEFHSLLNLNDDLESDVSDSHKYSNWYTGFFSGEFYGGNVLNMNANSAIWHGGILNDIDIIGINSTSSNIFLLDGLFRFNIGDEFYVVDDMIAGSYSSFGSTQLPIKYKVLDTSLDEDLLQTEIFVDIKLSSIMSIDTGVTQSGLKCVSKFTNSRWDSGIWFNGVFESGNFNGGIWYNGNFSGTWG